MWTWFIPPRYERPATPLSVRGECRCCERNLEWRRRHIEHHGWAIGNAVSDGGGGSPPVDHHCFLSFLFLRRAKWSDNGNPSINYAWSSHRPALDAAMALAVPRGASSARREWVAASANKKKFRTSNPQPCNGVKRTLTKFMKYISCFGLACLLLAGCAAPPRKSASWEYKNYSLAGVGQDDPNINMLGNQGWELAGYTYVPEKNESHYVFKRQK
jgi:hypothetical protein